jgi:hypothetical protein
MSTQDAVATYCAASAARDIERLIGTLAPDAEIVSPLSGRMIFRGREDAGVLLDAVYSTVQGLSWGEQVGGGASRVVIGTARVAGLRLDDAMVFELADDGSIRRVRPHLRPWLAVTAFALQVAARMLRHPAVLLRALRG